VRDAVHHVIPVVEAIGRPPATAVRGIASGGSARRVDGRPERAGAS